MPKIMNSTTGTIDKWMKREGESFRASDSLCEVTLDGLTIQLNAGQDGFLADIMKEVGNEVLVETPVALFVNDKDHLMEYMDTIRTEAYDAIREEDVIEAEKEKSNQAIDNMTLMREIKKMMQSGVIPEGSDLGRNLLSLARKDNLDLLSLFKASFDGNNYDPKSFDSKFFLENALEVIKEAKS